LSFAVLYIRSPRVTAPRGRLSQNARRHRRLRFKAINDHFRHDIGGEEFALLLPETNAAAAHIVAERLRAMVTAHDERLNPSVSIGIATATLSMSGIATLMKRGDDTLYEAKRSGRDRVSVASEMAGRKFPVAAE
jgi:predicted signal transduction protein with EAL and GGDEF domain